MLLGARVASLRWLTGRLFARREDVLRYQSQRLRYLVRQAAATVPYYRARFAEHGLDVNRLEGLRDLPRIPLTSKSDLLGTPTENLLHRRLRRARLLRRTTSGSTGQPFTVHCTPFEDRYLSALRLRIFLRMGVRVTDRTAHITFFKSRPDRGGRPGWLNRWGLFRTVLIDSALSQVEIARRLESLRPDVIRGYSNLTSLVADAIQAGSLRVRPRLVLVGGDNLTAAMRERMVAAFQAPVREIYGSHEVNLAAWECDRSGELHVCEEAVILEVIRDGRAVEPGERGELVATALHSFAQPFIRYRLGDIVTRGAETCACGLPYATIQSVEGRIYDRVILPDGRAVSPSGILSRVKDGFRWVRQYQLVQERHDLVVLRLVAGAAPEPGDLARLGQMMVDFLGPGVQPRIELVEEIRLDPTGKFRASMSRVFSNYEHPDG